MRSGERRRARDRRRHGREPPLVRRGRRVAHGHRAEQPMLKRLERKTASRTRDERPAGTRRGSTVRGRELRDRGLDARALQRRRPARALRELRRVLHPAAGSFSWSTFARTTARREMQDRMNRSTGLRVLRLQPSDARHDPLSGLRGDGTQQIELPKAPRSSVRCHRHRDSRRLGG